MSSYEIYLLIGCLFGGMAFLSFSSVILDRGSVRIFGVFVAICLGLLYFAKKENDGVLNFHDVPPAINKLIGPWIRGEGN